MSQASHDVNADSSRSHSIFTIDVNVLSVEGWGDNRSFGASVLLLHPSSFGPKSPLVDCEKFLTVGDPAWHWPPRKISLAPGFSFRTCRTTMDRKKHSKEAGGVELIQAGNV